MHPFSVLSASLAHQEAHTHTHSHAPFSTLQNHLRVSGAAGRRPLDPSAPLPPLAPQPLFLGACSLSTSHSDLLSGRQVTRLPPRQAAARFPLPEHPLHAQPHSSPSHQGPATCSQRTLPCREEALPRAAIPPEHACRARKGACGQAGAIIRRDMS